MENWKVKAARFMLKVDKHGKSISITAILLVATFIALVMPRITDYAIISATTAITVIAFGK